MSSSLVEWIADPRLLRLAQAYEAIAPATVPALAQLYAADARFKDPFNDVKGRDAIAHIFLHMYEQVAHPRFMISHAAAQGDTGFLAWTMQFEPLNGGGAAPQYITGCTRIAFDAQGLVREHIDYWDAASELYEGLPVLGWVLRKIRKRLAAR